MTKAPKTFRFKCLMCGNVHERQLPNYKVLQTQLTKYAKRKYVVLYAELCQPCLAITIHEMELTPETRAKN